MLSFYDISPVLVLSSVQSVLKRDADAVSFLLSTGIDTQVRGGGASSALHFVFTT